MIDAIQIEPDAVYDDGALRQLLGLTEAALSAARKSGSLRFTRQGRRVLYLGRWIVEWMERDATKREGDADAR